MMKVSVVIPAKNEEANLGRLVSKITEELGVLEVIVVNDGSEDRTAHVADYNGARVINHPVSLGNGAAIKSGARAALGEYILFMDADGQHRPEDIPALLDVMQEREVDMVVAARDAIGQASKGRHLANTFYNYFASFVTGNRIEDLTSGFRVVKADKFRQFLSLLPNGFSYPTTSTMAFFRSGYLVCYVPVDVQKREGTSHIRPIKDGLRFLIIIFKVATLYSPLKVFLPIAALSFLLGVGRYLYTYFEMGTFTNMSALLMVSGVQIFLVGLVSEQITALMYKDKA